MDTQELLELARWLKPTAEEVYQKCRPVYDALRHNAMEGQKVPLEEQMNALIDVLKENDLLDLTYAQRRILESLEVEELLGEKGVVFVKDTMWKTGVDPATALNQFKEAMDSITSATQWAGQVIDALEDIFVEPDEPAQEDGKVILRIEFTGDAKIGNIKDWKDWSEKWHWIIQGIGRVVEQPPEDAQVISASRGSIVITLAASLSVVLLLAKITTEILKSAKAWTAYQISIEQFRREKQLTKRINKALTEEADSAKSSCVDAAMAIVKESHKHAINGETETLLRKAIENFVDFFDKGGQIDFGNLENNQEESDGIIEKYGEIVGEIRKSIEDQENMKRDLDKRIEANNIEEHTEESKE